MQVILDSLPYLLIGPFPDGPLGGLALTIVLSLFIGGASFGVGVFFAALALVPFSPVRLAARATVECVRGVPSLTFLFWMYFLVPRLLGVDLSPMTSAVIALSIYHGAYLAEDLRGGVQAVARGQWEAARATGLRDRQVFSRIVLPQAVRAVVPALINRFVNLFMYTSIISTLGILEFMRSAIIVNNRELIYPIEIFGFIGLVYLAICYGITRLGRTLERRWAWAPRFGSVRVAA